MKSLNIIGLSVLSAIVYGIIHDQITARVCLEYFTIGHPPVFHTQDPTLLALGWGVIATWWVGLPLGVMLALASQLGSWPKLHASQLVKPIIILCTVMGICALCSGSAGAYLARNGEISLQDYNLIIPEKAQIGFMADLWAHSASYASGISGGVVLVIWAIFYRKSLSTPPKGKS